jgi:hypothetical protein
LIDKFSEPLIGDYPEEFRTISLFDDKEAVFRFFMTGSEDGIQGDFEKLVRINFDSPCSFEWFTQVWTKNFPYFYTESDKPQCVQCYNYKIKAKEAFGQNDVVGVQAVSDEEHSFNTNCIAV